MSTEPIVLVIELDLTPRQAWAAFAEDFARWWPVRTHSLSRDAATRCELEPRDGGLVTELAPDGTTHRWGEILAVEPGQRIRFSWHPGREPDSAQWVDVRFVAQGDGCRATLTHGGWEALGEIAPILRAEYVPGWQQVFAGVFAAFASRRH